MEKKNQMAEEKRMHLVASIPATGQGGEIKGFSHGAS